MWETGHNNMTFTTVEQKKFHVNTLRHTRDTVILLKTAEKSLF